MAKRPITAHSIVQRIKDEEIRFLDLKFVDLFGMLQHLTVPAEIVSEDIFRQGVGFDGSSVRGFQSIQGSDMTLLPDAASVFHDPFFEEPTLSVFCNIVDPERLRPYTRDPRGIARKAESLVRSIGLADEAFFGPEIEFSIFDDVRFDQATQHGYYFLNSEAAFWSAGDQGGKPNLGHQASRK